MVCQEQNQTTRSIQKKQVRVQTDTAGTHLSVNKLVNQVN